VNGILAVLDAQVWVSAALNPKGAPRAIVEAALAGGLRLLTSTYVREEVLGVWRRAEIVPRLQPGFDPAEWLEMIETVAADVVGDAEGPPLTADPKDDPYLWTAWAGGASHVVSKDALLLALKHYRGAQIEDPVAFLKGLRRRRPGSLAEPVAPWAQPEAGAARTGRRRASTARI
jgi:predicted nucleic acid-binding protein